MDGSEIKEVFSGTRGKVLIAVGIGGIGFMWWNRSRSAPAVQADPLELGPDGLHADGRGGASAPGGSTGSETSPGTTPKSGRPTTNAEWLDKAVNILSAPPYNYSETAVFNAIMKAFGGQPITAGEENWIRAAMSALGSPPEGMPPLNITAPTPPAQQPPPAPAPAPKPAPAPAPAPKPAPAPAPKPAPAPQRTHTVRSGDTLWDISQRWYGTPHRYMDIYWKNEYVIVTRARQANVWKDYAKHIYPGTVLVIP